MRKILLATLLSLFLQAGIAQATISVNNLQTNINLVMEDGTSSVFPLFITFAGGEVLTSSGPLSSWTKFGVNNQDNLTLQGSGSLQLPVNITVPDGQAIGTYTGEIRDGSTVLSTITVIITIPTGEIKTLQALSQVNQEVSQKLSIFKADIDAVISNKFKDIQSEITTIKSDLSQSIQDVKTSNKKVSDLENTKAVLEAKIQNLTSETSSLENRTQSLKREKENLELTSSILRSESPILFALGLLFGIGGTYVFYRKLHRYL